MKGHLLNALLALVFSVLIWSAVGAQLTTTSTVDVDCAIKVIKAIKFPASPKGMVTEVNYPYDLNPPK